MFSMLCAFGIADARSRSDVSSQDVIVTFYRAGFAISAQVLQLKVRANQEMRKPIVEHSARTMALHRR
ncbi:TPA: hypothetical protein HH295_04775 [Xanthomonas vasicola pv. zeae]|uniref:Uncharacterized protein n=4 Tax=Xanthomonas vasicola TaxID=56459 RepID=A0A836P1F7_XANVA|nr:hypothetical protein [Xanthomonas vasicola]KFA33975.1 hypothetical protein KWS_0112370 [Xanthomonas vasicola pv. musacearum NCPPB 4384]AVQ08059.1 hypothetical protein C7V42_17070 [Xanthomonas vasicola pv. vasculorum]AZM72258.1 hypothetical protein CXP37_17090 [Xanthomonas vasicola pv. vasculorum]AZR25794.1 hypothetical protein NX80_004030 [Xanthomonas vasicola pv. arecae]AZR32214.1 hypothetical protein KWO_018665 [Xanthomonas vasicola pv. musacearum NCPPB 4379]